MASMGVKQAPGSILCPCKDFQAAAVAVAELCECGCESDGELIDPLLLEPAKLCGCLLEGVLLLCSHSSLEFLPSLQVKQTQITGSDFPK